ncbi:MAG: hypothetical protein AAF602_27565 [Myxococcota bacterium]
MIRTARENPATIALLEHVEAKATGSLSLGAAAAERSLHLLQGHLIAATAYDDPSRIIQVLRVRGLLSPRQAATLQSRSSEGADIFGDLLELAGGPVFDGILRDRFYQNLCDVLSSEETPRFKPQRGIFVHNIQMGHDTAQLVRTACNDCDTAGLIDLDAAIVRGPADAGTGPARALLVARLDDRPQSVRDLIEGSPFEPIRARLLIAELLREGVIDFADVRSDEPDEPTTPTPTPVELEPTTILPSRTPRPAPAHGQGAQSSNAEPGEREDVDDGPTEHVEQATMNDLLGGSEELDAFEDHDYSRGAPGQGRFTTEDHHRDRVEVASLGSRSPDLAVRYSSPVITEAEATTKVHVTNEVLGAVVRAFDDSEGVGRGRALVQLLVTGAPMRFSPLLRDLMVDESGGLPERQVLHNLFGRPAAEHRQLLNGGLVDLIDRALSSAADELPEEHLDEVLTQVAGYRQRLGV